MMASGPTFTVPENGRSKTTAMKSSEKMRTESNAVMSICALRFLVPKKNVKVRVRTAPAKRTAQSTPGTDPSAAAIRLRRACVSVSS